MIERHITFSVHPDETAAFEQFMASEYGRAMATVARLREARPPSGSRQRHALPAGLSLRGCGHGRRLADVGGPPGTPAGAQGARPGHGHPGLRGHRLTGRGTAHRQRSRRGKSMVDEVVLVTGGTGCIGSWVVRNLVREGVPVVVLTAGRRSGRLGLILTDAELAAITFVTGDISGPGAARSAARQHRVTRIIHLAGMQFPFCAADPIRGAQVNVGGTVTVFELAKRIGIDRVVYASSAAVFGPRATTRRRSLARTQPSSRPPTTASTRSPTSRAPASTGRTMGSPASGFARIRCTARDATRASPRSRRWP